MFFFPFLFHFLISSAQNAEQVERLNESGELRQMLKIYKVIFSLWLLCAWVGSIFNTFAKKCTYLYLRFWIDSFWLWKKKKHSFNYFSFSSFRFIFVGEIVCFAFVSAQMKPKHTHSYKHSRAHLYSQTKMKSMNTSYTCQLCGGYRLLPCPSCSGSKKSVHRNHFTTEFVALKCMNCDEVGLVKCYNCN